MIFVKKISVCIMGLNPSPFRRSLYVNLLESEVNSFERLNKR
ncbi:MAG: hypothetical protein ABFD25_06325 [Clostridiaceae bacterium]